MYLIISAIVSTLATFQMLKGVLSMHNALAAGDFPAVRRTAHVVIGLVMLPALLMIAPVVSSFYDVIQFETGKGVSSTTGRTTVWLALVGSILIVGIAISQGFINRKRAGFWFVGRLLVTGTCGVLGIIAASSHLTWVDKKTGWVDFSFFREQVKDMHCDSDIVLFRGDLGQSGEPVQYRCPHAFLLNRFASNPFVPWPDYSEGVSADLGTALNETFKDAHTPAEATTE